MMLGLGDALTLGTPQQNDLKLGLPIDQGILTLAGQGGAPPNPQLNGDLGPGSLGLPSGIVAGDQPTSGSNPLNCGLYNCGQIGYGGTAGPQTASQYPTPDYTPYLYAGLGVIAFVLVATAPKGDRR